jgi:phosphotransferase system enzyme I (PtsI)
MFTGGGEDGPGDPKPVHKVRSRGERVKGIAVGGGVAVGVVHVLNRRLKSVPHRRIRIEEAVSERSRLARAFALAVRHFDEARTRLQIRDLRKFSDIVEAYRLMTADPALSMGAADTIQNELVNAEWALEREVDRMRAALQDADDAYLVERATDLDHIADKVMRNLLGVAEPVQAPPSGDTVIVAHDLSPADIFSFTKHKVVAFSTDVGGPTSHNAILARSLGIPAVIGATGVSEKAVEGEEIIIDGIHGDVWLSPERQVRNRLVAMEERYKALMTTLSSETGTAAVTADRKAVTLMANIESTEELESAKSCCAMGIGLLRTEYLFVNRRRPPTEEEHFRAYRQLAVKAAPHPVTIRTLDVGGDKVSGPFRTSREPNPALGMRAIRFCLREKRIFVPQIRGILRASAHGKVRLMLPMISSIEEAREAKQIIAAVSDEFDKSGVPYDREMEIGCMIEVPAAAVIADLLAKEFDFFSIGTNDLIQYTLAVDRGNDRVAHLFQPLNPAVLRLIGNTVKAGKRYGVRTAVCGEMASDPIHFLLLLGAGVREFSMYPQAIPFIRHTVRSTTMPAARSLFEAVYNAVTISEAHTIADRFLEEHFPEVSRL